MAKKLTKEYVKQKVEEKGYIFISMERIKGKLYVTKICKNGHESTSSWSNFNNYGCKYCSNNVTLTYEEVKEYIENINYKLLSTEYKNAKTKLLVQCDKKHEPYEVRLDSLKRGSRCPICSKIQSTEKHKYNYDEVKKYIESFGYKLLSTEYKTIHEKLLIQCDKGHNPYEVTYSKFKNQDRRCPHCKNSKGEKRISEVLDKINVIYEIQYKFDDCKFKYKLPFDFYLPQYNICIEYDGGQHFEIVEYFGGLDGFINTKIRDTIKNDYCKKNNINLIRIPYWEFDNIEKILNRELNLYK